MLKNTSINILLLSLIAGSAFAVRVPTVTTCTITSIQDLGTLGGSWSFATAVTNAVDIYSRWIRYRSVGRGLWPLTL